MNFASVIAFVMAGAVFFLGIFTATDNVRSFLDYHAALIVFGGTIAVTAISFQIDRILLMLKVFYRRVIQGRKTDYTKVIRELMVISEAFRQGPDATKAALEKTQDLFLKEGMGILMDDYLTDEQLYEILNLRAETVFNRYTEDAKKFKAIGKFPPAMGLMGAVLGMIALLQTLGQPGAEKNVGPAMSVALVATLYGIAFANLFIIPIAENLSDTAREIHVKNRIIVEGIRLIAQRKNRILFAEELNSFLLPNERINWKELNTGQKAA